MALTTGNWTLADGDLLTASSIVSPAATWLIGSNVSTNGNHACLSFTDAAWATLASTNDGVVKDAELFIKVATSGTPSGGFDLWGATFANPATISFATDYGGAENNQVPLTNNAYRVKIHKIIAGGVALTAGQVVSCKIPSMLFAGRSHVMLQIRPDVTGVPVATHAVEIHSPTAVSPSGRPTLTVTYGTKADYLDPESGFRTLHTGSNSFMAIGVEELPGVPVKPNIILDVIDPTMTPVPQQIVSPARNRSRISPSKMSVGRIRVSGGASIVLTPERWFPLLLTQYKLASTTNEGLIDGVQVYEHTFKVGQPEDTKTLTVLLRKGNIYELYTGCRVANLNFSITQDDAVTASFDIFAKAVFIYDEMSAGGDDLPFILGATAAEDSDENSFYTFIHAYVDIDGNTVEAECIRTISLGVGQNVYEKTGLSRRREVQGHYLGGVSASIDVERYFVNEADLFRVMGHEAWGFPLAGKKQLVQQNYEVLLESPRYNDSGTSVQSIRFVMPIVQWAQVTTTNPRDEAIMLTQQGAVLKDDALGTNFRIIVRNSHPASFFDPLTDRVTVIPVRQ